MSAIWVKNQPGGGVAVGVGDTHALYLTSEEWDDLRRIAGYLRPGLPTRPGAYWNQKDSLSDVYTLYPDGHWHHNITGRNISPGAIPVDGLELLGIPKGWEEQ